MASDCGVRTEMAFQVGCTDQSIDVVQSRSSSHLLQNDFFSSGLASVLLILCEVAFLVSLDNFG
jgi:hypothetical protein